MRFTVRTATAVAACAVVAGVGATAGLAAPPQPVVIQLDLRFTSPTTTAGTFTMAGALADRGTATQTLEFVDSTVFGVQTMTSPAGTIQIRFRSLNTPISPTTSFTAGRWRITGGTGAYAGLRGRGRGFGVADLGAGTLGLTYVGRVHIDPEPGAHAGGKHRPEVAEGGKG